MYLTDVNGTLFFNAGDGVHGRELWKSDGTELGTVMVKDIRPGSDGSLPKYLTDVNGTLFFCAYYGLELFLWKSDGTPDGTLLIEEIYTPNEMIDVNGMLFFDNYLEELWALNVAGSLANFIHLPVIQK